MLYFHIYSVSNASSQLWSSVSLSWVCWVEFSATASPSLWCMEDDKICRDQESLSKTWTMNSGCIWTVFWQSVLLTKQFPSMNTISLEWMCSSASRLWCLYTDPLWARSSTGIDLRLHRSTEYRCTEIAKFQVFLFKFYRFLFVLRHLLYLLLRKTNDIGHTRTFVDAVHTHTLTHTHTVLCHVARLTR